MHVFIYGSLKRGFGNHGVMERLDAKFIKEAITTFPYFDLLDLHGFPGMSYIGKNSYRIFGELYSVVKEKVKGVLDPFEGHPDFYHRNTIMVEDAFVDTYFITNTYLDAPPVETFHQPDVKVWL